MSEVAEACAHEWVNRINREDGEPRIICLHCKEEGIQCWCGARGTFDSLFSSDSLGRCHGTGMLECYCGGDLCVCHNHGEVDCPGCDDCEADDGNDFDDFDYDDN